jgi:hypothetical protein
MLPGRSDNAVAAVEDVDTLAVAAEDDDVDGCTTMMEAFACIRVRIVSIGWMARVEIPPEIQPAVKSIQNDSLDIVCLLRG